MFRRAAGLTLLIAISTACTMWKKPPSGWSGATAGEQIENLFWKDVAAKDWKEVDRHIASMFTATAPGGSMDRAAFLRHLQQAPVSEVMLSDCNVQSNGADLIVACTMRGRWGANPPFAVSTLSVWQQLKKGWVMVAHSETPLALPPSN